MSLYHRHITTGFLLSLGALLLSSCGGDNEQTATGPAQQPELNCSAQTSRLDDPRLTTAGSEESFMQVARGYLSEIGTAGCAAQRASPEDSGADIPFPAMPAAGDGNSGGGAGAPAAPASNDLRSDTNVQEVGIDEADLVETDGRYLYIANAGARYGIGAPPMGRETISVAPAAADDPIAGAPSPEAADVFVRVLTLNNNAPAAQPLTRINLPNSASNIQGLYLRNSGGGENADQLLVVAGGTVKEGAMATFGTLVFAYDVSTPAQPRLTWTLGVGSNHSTSRLKDGTLYLVENSYVSGVPVSMSADGAEPINDTVQSRNIADITPADLLPPIYLDGEAKNFVKASDCLVPVAAANPDLYVFPDLVTVLAVDVADPNNTRGLCTLESSGEVYVSNSALYLARNNGSETLVHKIRLTPAGMEYAASGVVPGSIGGTNTRFALSEKDQDLRIVTTAFTFEEPISSPAGGVDDGGSPDSAPNPEGAGNGNVVATPASGTDGSNTPNTGTAKMARAVDDTDHRLFILREDADAKLLKQIASLPNESRSEPLGKPGENLHGVRFVGDSAYLVTFKKTDPFYVIDLSNPEDPFVAGELLLPGYSDYLQPLGDNLVLGVGKDAIEQGDVAWYQGVKVGVFDVTDPTQPKVLGEKLIGKRGTESPALADHHAVTVLSNPEAGTYRIAIPVQVHEDSTDNGGDSRDPSNYFNWSYNGLFLFTVANGSNEQTASFAEEGVIVGDRADSANGHYYYGTAQRGIIVGDAVHYASDDGVWSAKWQSPGQVVGPQ